MDRNSTPPDAVRGMVEDAIEALLALLDAIDGDSSLEDDEREGDFADDEPGDDDEPEDRL
jgi:hypothetical protein